jgi:hypothetical protein
MMRFPVTPESWQQHLQEQAEGEHGPTALVIAAKHVGAVTWRRRTVPKGAKWKVLRHAASGRLLEITDPADPDFARVGEQPARISLIPELISFCERRLSAMPHILWYSEEATPEFPYLPSFFHSLRSYAVLIFASRTDKRAFIAFIAGKPIPKKRGRKPKLTPKGRAKRERRKERRTKFRAELTS